MSSNDSIVHQIDTTIPLILIETRSTSYMAGDWSGYGYLGVVQILDWSLFVRHGLAGQLRNIDKVQRVVWRTPKIHMFGPTEHKWQALRGAWLEDKDDEMPMPSEGLTDSRADWVESGNA